MPSFKKGGQGIQNSINSFQDAWVAQLVRHPHLGFVLGHDLGVVRWSPMAGSVLSTGEILSLPLSFSLSNK